MNRPPCKVRSSAGAFTLIEILMAAAAATLILAAVYGVFGRAMHLRDAAVERTHAAHVQAHVATILRNDLRNGFISGKTLANSLEGSRLAPRSSFPGYLKLTTTTGQALTRDEATPDVHQVEYYVIADPDASGQKAGILVRAVDRNLLASIREEPEETRLLSGILSMEVSFFDGQNWTDVWQITDEEKTVPQGIRVHVTPDPESGVLPMEIVVPWTTQPVLPPGP
ncbi:MAG TPA: type II secretion system protein GspJ [Chthoniobacteraceae bacterium]|nr:type II secretion system protein GspJ [Chthoniobacteraceae bacterium]